MSSVGNGFSDSKCHLLAVLPRANRTATLAVIEPTSIHREIAPTVRPYCLLYKWGYYYFSQPDRLRPMWPV
jgi:hypothetical protein